MSDQDLPYAEDIENPPDVEWEERDAEDELEVLDSDEPIDFEDALQRIPQHDEDAYIDVPHPDAENPDSMADPTLGFARVVSENLEGSTGMNDAIRRGIRTLLWAILATAGAFAPVAAAFNLDPSIVAKVMAVFGLIVAVLTAIINSLEDNVDWFPALLKKPASEGQNPVPDNDAP